MKKIRIIITDDHSLYRSGVRTALAKYNDIQFLAEADHGQDLLDKLEYLRPEIVITGINMPVMDGTKLVPILKERYPGIKIIVISMMDDSSMIKKMISLGANAYLTKTVSEESIYAAIIACTNS
jgi:DNA-binding NarL/FixJ family response regulator